MSDDTLDALLTIFGILFGLYAVERIWSTKARPWVEAKWQELSENGLSSQHLIGSYDLMDLAGVAVLAVPAGLVLLVAIRAVTRGRRTPDTDTKTKPKEGR
ncbi:MAG: hypothetical protein AAGC63_15780 [Propionicimonas sp.]|nr:hypothetical protein [Propionicimonas sp.]